MTLTASDFFSTAPGQISARAEDQFFRAIRNKNRTFKFTGAARLTELDMALVDHLERTGSRISQVLDIGISSGVTTLELVERLQHAGFAPHIVATDLTMRAYIVPVLPGCRALVDDEGHVLQYEFFGLAMNAWQRRLDYVNGMVLVRRAAHAICDARARRAKAAGAGAGVRQVALVTPRLKARHDVTPIEDDIMVRNRAFERRFDLVRAANILNSGYFPEASLRRGLSNVLSYLAGPGALLLIGRTVEQSGNHATLFEVAANGQRLNIVSRFGKGSEVEELVLDTPLGLRPAEAPAYG